MYKRNSNWIKLNGISVCKRGLIEFYGCPIHGAHFKKSAIGEIVWSKKVSLFCNVVIFSGLLLPVQSVSFMPPQ